MVAIIGVPWNEALTAGALLGQKIILNEFVAFSKLGPIISDLSQKNCGCRYFSKLFKYNYCRTFNSIIRLLVVL